MHPVSLEGPVAVSQEPKPRSAQRPGFLAEFAAGGIHHPLSGFDCASGHLDRNFRKIGFIEHQKTAGCGRVDQGFLNQNVPSMPARRAIADRLTLSQTAVPLVRRSSRNQHLYKFLVAGFARQRKRGFTMGPLGIRVCSVSKEGGDHIRPVILIVGLFNERRPPTDILRLDISPLVVAGSTEIELHLTRPTDQ